MSENALHVCFAGKWSGNSEHGPLQLLWDEETEQYIFLDIKPMINLWSLNYNRLTSILEITIKETNESVASNHRIRLESILNDRILNWGWQYKVWSTKYCLSAFVGASWCDDSLALSRGKWSGTQGPSYPLTMDGRFRGACRANAHC